MKQDYPIRVLQVIGVMNRGGAESMIMNLYRQIDRSKVQFDFVEHTDMQAVFDEEILSLGGRIYHCPRFTGKNYYIYKKWWKRFFQTDGSTYKIVHGHIGSTAGIYLEQAKKAGKYTIAHSHNTKGSMSAKELLYRIISYRVRKIADCFFACSQAAGKDRFGKKIEFYVLNNAIKTEDYIFSSRIRKEIRNEFGIRNELVIGNVARFSLQKNHMFLIKVFYALKKKKNDVKLLLVGDGEEFEKIKNKVHDLDLDNSVIFTGVRSDVNKLMQAMDIFVFPSFFEGLGIAVVEAQAAGLPCIISDVIPDECNMVKDLVIKLNLKEPISEWADSIINISKQINRVDTSKKICDAGYDIKDTAKWLEDFYLEKIKNKVDNIYTDL